MKHLPLLLVIVGMGMAAAFGSQNADPIRLAQIVNGRAAVLGTQVGKTHTAYCKTLPGGERTKQQLDDGCEPVPTAADEATVEALETAWTQAHKPAAAFKQLAKQRKSSYCRLAADDALSPEQTKDGCPAVKRNGTAAEVATALGAWETAKKALSPVEVEAQAKRADYCALVVEGKSTEEQVKDGCAVGSAASDAAKVSAARVAWQAAWVPVPGARTAVKKGYGSLCGVKVDGQLIAAQRSASCQPAKQVASASEVSEARAKWREVAGDGEPGMAKAKAAKVAKVALCAVATDGKRSKGQKKAGCPPVPSKGEAAQTDKARLKWVETKELAGHAKAAQKYAAGSVDPGTRLSGWFRIAGLPFFLGLLLMGIGGFLARKAAKQEASAASSGDSKSGAAPVDFGELLAATVDKVAKLRDETLADTSPSQETLDRVQATIEAIQTDAIEPMVATRGSLVARYGMSGFAEVFGPFSAGERYINRAWSSLVDLYWHETARSLGLAAEHLGEAQVALEKVVAEHKNKG